MAGRGSRMAGRGVQGYGLESLGWLDRKSRMVGQKVWDGWGAYHRAMAMATY